MTHRSKVLDELLSKMVKVTFRDGNYCTGFLFYNRSCGKYSLRKYEFVRTDGAVLKGHDENSHILFAKSNMRKVEEMARGKRMTREEIIDGLRMTIGLFLFDPSTGNVLTKNQLNDLDRTTVEACEGAIKILEG